MLGAASAALLLVLGGGGVAAFQVLNGGGTQPDQVVPADTVAFAKLDLNPSASQKIAAARLLHRIPKLGNGFSGGSSDWRKAIFDGLSSNDSLPPGVDFDHDIKPWLGKRAAVAVLPTLRDGDPEVLLVLQSTDDAKARVGISHFGSDNGVSFYRGYAVVGETQQIADRAVADAKLSNLSGSRQYSADMRQSESLGVSSGWADVGAIAKLAGDANPLSATAPRGRLAYTVRLTANSADLIGRSRHVRRCSPGQPARPGRAPGEHHDRRRPSNRSGRDRPQLAQLSRTCWAGTSRRRSTRTTPVSRPRVRPT